MKFNFIDPGAIMGVVVSLIILAVGVFAFFVTINNIPGSDAPTNVSTADYNRTYSAIGNISGTGDSVFNIIGVVLIIGAIMSIVGLVYNYVR